MANTAAAFTTFGALLRYLRRRARLTQIDLAIATGYSTGQISRLEQNQRSPNPDVVHALFVPALALDGEPELAARLLELARAAQVAPDGERHAATSDPDDAAAGQPATSVEDGPLVGGPLLRTKLYLPRPRPSLVARPRLLQRLDAALEVPLTLVSAPAGWGKTSLVSQWLTETRIKHAESRTVPAGLDTQDSGTNQQRRLAHFSMLNTHFKAAWLSLDDGDNDPLTFLRYLIAALQTVDAGLGGAALALIHTPQPPPIDLVMRTLLNDLAALTSETVLVLEDYHRLTAPGVHLLLTQVLEHAPPTLHVVIASRADPPLPIARLRARGQLVELRAGDLRFTPDDASLFLRDVMDVSLSADEVAALETRTEGWIAGLQLAALALRGRGDVTGFVSAFTGSNRFVVDYLAEEVFGRQPPHVQTFLLQTSILDRLCGPLCDAVMGVESDRSSSQAAYSQALLEELERANLFVVPLDDQRIWYRYHHLFGDVLRERLANGATTEHVARLHRRASAWYAQHGLLEEAIDHALAGMDWAGAARMLADHGMLLVITGRRQRVLAYIRSLPDAELRVWPEVEVIYAGTLMLDNQLPAATRWLDRAAHNVAPDRSPDDRRALSGAISMLRGNIRAFYGDHAAMFALMQQALELLPQDTSRVSLSAQYVGILRTAAQVFVATAYKITGDVTPPVEAQALAAIEPTRATGNFIATFNSFTYLARLQHLQGRLPAAAATYQAAAASLADPSLMDLMGASPSYFFGLGDLQREWNQIHEAERAIARGMAIAAGGVPVDADVIWQGYLVRARLHQARGDAAAAAASIDAYAALARREAFADDLLLQAAAARARLALMRGDYRAAGAWADACTLRFDDAVSFASEYVCLTLVRVRIAQGQVTHVLPVLERWLADARANARMHSAIEILALQAVAYHTLDEHQSAATTVEQALVLAEPARYVRIFVDEGLPMLHVLQTARMRGIRPVYVATLLAAFAERGEVRSAAVVVQSTPQPPSSTLASPMVEPLTQREREVLRLIAGGLDNRAIAARLVVDVSTVKKHINSVFRKLGVDSRTQALVRARELGLL